MDNEQNLLSVPEPETQPNAAAEAFADLAASVTGMETRMERRMDMLTRAVEHVAIEKQSIEIPDYTPTLAKMNGVLADMTRRMRAVEEAPALQMTPENLGARMQAAATKARQDDQAMILQVKQTHSDAARALWELHGRVLTIQEQRRRLIAVAGGCVFAGCLLWSFIPGVIVRALPTDWHLPERLAARTVGAVSVWDAGSQMMQADNPSGWQAIVDAAEMRRQNRDTINACEQAAAKAREAVRCTIRIEKSQS